MDTALDIIIIGAGIFGISAARTYLDIRPDAQLLVLEADKTPGGVWSKSRSYPRFWCQTGLRLAEFSDSKLVLPNDAARRHDLFEAKHMSNYIEEYIDSHIYAGKSLRERIRFGFSVQRITKEGPIWTVSGDAGRQFQAPKIIVASGHTSVPNIPTYSRNDFLGEIVHTRNFASSNVLSGNKRIVVIGGGKSAADMAYAAAKEGHQVSWIIRDSGHGAGLLAPIKPIGPYTNPNEVVMTRIASTLSPSYLNQQTAWTRFLHGTRLGRKCLQKAFGKIEKSTCKSAGFERSCAKEGFRLLRPDPMGFWMDCALGLIQAEDFWDVVAEKVQVYRGNVLELDEHAVRLEDGSVIPCDAILLGTGFLRVYPFLDKQQHVELGLSHDKEDSVKEAEWAKLHEKADQEVINKFPMLAGSPIDKTASSKTPFRLYNCIASLSDDSIAFLGCISLANMFMGAEVQALWATAYLDKTINLPPIDDMRRHIARDNAWSMRRYPYLGRNNGITFNNEAVGYADKLLRELDLSSHRRSWWNHWTGVFTAESLKGIKDEYLSKKVQQPNRVNI